MKLLERWALFRIRVHMAALRVLRQCCWDLTRVRLHYCRGIISATYATEEYEEGYDVEDSDIEVSQDETSPSNGESTNETSATFIEPPKTPVAPSSHESPSSLYDPLAMKFINCMMWDGKKSLSQRIFKEALEVVKKAQLSKLRSSSEKEVEVNPLAVFHQAVENAKPLLGTSSIKKGGKIYLVPHPLNPKRRQFLAIKWMVKAAREGKEKGMAKKLGAEILDAYNNQGTVIKRKQDLHRVAEANRAFAHFRW